MKAFPNAKRMLQQLLWRVWARTYRHIDIGPVVGMRPVVISAGIKVAITIGRASQGLNKTG